MRNSSDEIRAEHVWNGYDYKLQVWIENGIIQDCNHPQSMKDTGCCTSHTLAGRNIFLVPTSEQVTDTIIVGGIDIRLSDQTEEQETAGRLPRPLLKHLKNN